MQTDGYEDEIEMCKVLDELSALSQGMLNHLCPVHPWKKRVLSMNIVAVYIDKGKKTVSEFVENIVGFPGNVVLQFVIACSL